MRVLVLHNRYRQPGGEDEVARAEIHLLREHGVEVLAYEVDNDEFGPRTALDSAWSQRSYDEVLRTAREFRPDVAHVHNFWLKLTPAVHAACRAAGAATVQTLHNFRLLCVNALFLRDGQVCEDCLGRSPWRGVVRRCYRDSFVASAAVGRMIQVNRRRGTWERDVDACIVLSQAARARFQAAGFDPGKLFLKPNFCEDPGEPPAAPSGSGTVLCAGRLSEEKGIEFLIDAWRIGGLGRYGNLVIAGDGPLRADLERRAAGIAGVRFLGRVDSSAMSDLYRGARAVALPSICFEQFPRAVVEAFAHGRPVVASDIGGLGELVTHDRSGRKFAPKDASMLARELEALLRDHALADRLGRAARAEYLDRYTAAANFARLMEIYAAAGRPGAARAHHESAESSYITM